MDVATGTGNSMPGMRQTSRRSSRDDHRLVGLATPRLHGAPAALPAAVATIAGVVFLAFGVGHFAHHASEVADFRRYEVPVASLAVWSVGAAEVLAGLALVLGLFVRVAASVLAADMVGVVATAGRVEGGFLNLGVAPILFVGMVFLVWAGPGPLALEVLVARRP
jgi:uncharacterized membrane protein YphA (DoxX/SURF4 family)